MTTFSGMTDGELTCAIAKLLGWRVELREPKSGKVYPKYYGIAPDGTEWGPFSKAQYEQWNGDDGILFRLVPNWPGDTDAALGLYGDMEVMIHVYRNSVTVREADRTMGRHYNGRNVARALSENWAVMKSKEAEGKGDESH